MSTEDTPKPVAWMTMESARRLSLGGNIKGAVPVHLERSVTAKIPLFDQATIDAAVAAMRERCATICEQVSDDGTMLGGEDAHALVCADRIRRA